MQRCHFGRKQNKTQHKNTYTYVGTWECNFLGDSKTMLEFGNDTLNSKNMELKTILDI